MRFHRATQRRWMFAALLAAVCVVAKPAPASAQCGDCYSILVAHVFTMMSPLATYACDNAGGCHFDWYTGPCSQHAECPLQQDAVETAINAGDSVALLGILAHADNWRYDRLGHAVMFTCGGYVVARYVLSEKMDVPLRTGLLASKP